MLSVSGLFLCQLLDKKFWLGKVLEKYLFFKLESHYLSVIYRLPARQLSLPKNIDDELTVFLLHSEETLLVS